MAEVTAIFERDVFRPIDPVRVADGSRVELQFEEPHADPQRAKPVVARGPHGLPVVIVPPGSPVLTNEIVATALDETP